MVGLEGLRILLEQLLSVGTGRGVEFLVEITKARGDHVREKLVAGGRLRVDGEFLRRRFNGRGWLVDGTLAFDEGRHRFDLRMVLKVVFILAALLRNGIGHWLQFLADVRLDLGAFVVVEIVAVQNALFALAIAGITVVSWHALETFHRLLSIEQRVFALGEDLFHLNVIFTGAFLMRHLKRKAEVLAAPIFSWR